MTQACRFFPDTQSTLELWHLEAWSRLFTAVSFLEWLTKEQRGLCVLESFSYSRQQDLPTSTVLFFESPPVSPPSTSVSSSPWAPCVLVLSDRQFFLYLQDVLYLVICQHLGPQHLLLSSSSIYLFIPSFSTHIVSHPHVFFMWPIELVAPRHAVKIQLQM